MKYSIKKLFVVYVLFCIPSFLVAGIWPRKMIISVPVADMRHTPEVAKKLTYEKMDWKQTSQLLFGDRVLAFEEKKGWLRVHAIDQEVFVKNKWYPCSGWIKANQARWVKRFPEYNLVVNKPFARIKISKKRSVILSLGTKLYGERLIKGSRLSLKDKVWELRFPSFNNLDRFRDLNKSRKGYISSRDVNFCKLSKGRYRSYIRTPTEKDLLRANIVKTAYTFLGAPYFWGGRSFYDSDLKNRAQLTSVDCSGLVGLCYQSQGITVPRNSKSQYQRSKKLFCKPKVGDLIFLASKRKPQNIRHVMIYCGEDKMIEARGQKIREVITSTGTEFLGKHIDGLKSGDKVDPGYVYFGSYIY